MSDQTKQSLKHPSYGFIRLNRSSGGDGRLFMSPLRHDHRISIEIGEASYERSLSIDGHFTGKPLIRLDMSDEQFARFITSGGIHNGTPCTLTRIGNELIAGPPGEVKSETWYKEMRGCAKSVIDDIEGLSQKITPLIAKLPKRTQEEILAAISGVSRVVGDHMPWVVQSLHEAMDKVVNSAKIEVEAYVNNRLSEIQAAGGELDGAHPVLAIEFSSTTPVTP